jgi:hypothetical protein
VGGCGMEEGEDVVPGTVSKTPTFEYYGFALYLLSFTFYGILHRPIGTNIFFPFFY